MEFMAARFDKRQKYNIVYRQTQTNKQTEGESHMLLITNIIMEILSTQKTLAVVKNEAFKALVLKNIIGSNISIIHSYHDRHSH